MKDLNWQVEVKKWIEECLNNEVLPKKHYRDDFKDKIKDRIGEKNV